MSARLKIVDLNKVARIVPVVRFGGLLLFLLYAFYDTYLYPPGFEYVLLGLHMTWAALAVFEIELRSPTVRSVFQHASAFALFTWALTAVMFTVFGFLLHRDLSGIILFWLLWETPVAVFILTMWTWKFDRKFPWYGGFVGSFIVLVLFYIYGDLLAFVFKMPVNHLRSFLFTVVATLLHYYLGWLANGKPFTPVWRIGEKILRAVSGTYNHWGALARITLAIHVVSLYTLKDSGETLALVTVAIWSIVYAIVQTQEIISLINVGPYESQIIHLVTQVVAFIPVVIIHNALFPVWVLLLIWFLSQVSAVGWNMNFSSPRPARIFGSLAFGLTPGTFFLLAYPTLAESTGMRIMFILATWVFCTLAHYGLHRFFNRRLK